MAGANMYFYWSIADDFPDEEVAVLGPKGSNHYSQLSLARYSPESSSSAESSQLLSASSDLDKKKTA